MNSLYPLKFKPVFKDKIWGGQKIRTHLGLDFSPLKNCGEAWVLSGVEGSETIISNGFLKDNTLNEILEIYMDDLTGEKVFEQYGNDFPLLIKFIDSNDYLSIQVHPDDALASKKGLGNGKSEMWYILQADEDAKLYTGFNRELTQKTYLDHFEGRKLESILNVEKASANDVFYIPAGRIHALGPGILLAEIQQSSDTTYRIYDWDRVDEKGVSRELHTKEALEALDFTFQPSYRTNFKTALNQTSPVLDSPHFTVNQLLIDRPLKKDYSSLDSFVILLCLEGSARLDSSGSKTDIRAGEAVLVPATLDELVLMPLPKVKLLEVYV